MKWKLPIIEPVRVFIAVLFAASLWILPAATQPARDNTLPTRKPLQEYGGSVPAIAGDSFASCPNI